MLNPFKFFRNTTVGLALGSGGAKGLAHIAVIEYLESMNIPVDLVAGSSIGAVVGALYCAGRLDAFKEDIMRMGTTELLSYFDPVFPRSGLMEGKELMAYLHRYIPEDLKIEDLGKPLAVIATDYYTGQSVVFRKGNVHEALRASVSIPGVFVPVRFGSTFLIDGGVANPLPVNIARGMGAGLTVAVNLHPTIEKRKGRWKKYVKSRTERSIVPVDSREIDLKGNHEKKEIKISGSPSKNRQGWLRAIEQWIRPENKNHHIPMPNIFEVIMQTIDIMEYTNTQMMLKYNTPTVLIEPMIMDAGTLDFGDARRIITEGYVSCNKARRDLQLKIKSWI